MPLNNHHQRVSVEYSLDYGILFHELYGIRNGLVDDVYSIINQNNSYNQFTMDFPRSYRLIPIYSINKISKMSFIKYSTIFYR